MSSSVRSGTLTLLHTACGAGILAMPYAFQPFGVFPGLFLIAFCGACAMLGLILQSTVAKYVPERNASFFALSQVTNPKFSVLFDIAIAVKCFGVGVSYMIVVGDVMPQILGTFTDTEFFLNRNVNITIVMLFIVTPLCFLKNLNSLRYASIAAISAVIYLCFLVMFHFFIPNEEIRDTRGPVSWGFPKDGLNPLNTLPIFVFAYTCHHNMFSVINEQQDIHFNKLKQICIFAMLLACTLYIIIGGSGYLTFGNAITGNIITLYSNSAATTVGRIAIVILVMLAFPLQCHPARASINHILHYFQLINCDNNQVQESESGHRESSGLIDNEITPQPQLQEAFEQPPDEVVEEEFPEQQKSFEPVTLDPKTFTVVTICILICSYILAVSVTSLAKVLAIVGATGSTSIAFILPGVFGYQLIGSEYSTSQIVPLPTKLLKYSAVALTIWGVFVMTASLFAALFLGASH
ncbi:hypothetical protein TPHA_0K00670 [Tetrapisispora phaffii CBS 4417]|uniref:Amino acid transporter transmembrane domain-containing protein n=1 Tax=Tetrapisispora phaffii (strain ATCC 24235 / CBS 4417 / NBRC 1672 / NRRL Y-8282 / UCD 70-5) TaxID=1071381 RepID=G8BZ73_TETPH|nr:hypothetical protein TPHA_0K00670 [Tetrapisispora phaffii CBS 4417]CCE65201.1 hypothetical protein TPHA_0K00670 [Tetrapisispora phaffii CBS 4417]